MTLLIYNHYDVQPAGDEKLWESKPFEPEVRDGHIYARGVADNKGNLLMRLQAIRYYLENYGDLPIRIIYLVEGEEEIGSPNLDALAKAYGHLWKDADLCIWETGGVNEEGSPHTELGMKGVTYLELHSKLGDHDLHSGEASMFESPVWRLVQALNTLRSPEGKVLIDGIREQIKPPAERELQMIKDQMFDLQETLRSEGRDSFLNNEKDKDNILKFHYFEPTCNICGIWGGFMEPGGIKTIIPMEATAKIDLRLVADLDASQIAGMIRAHLDKRGFTDIEVKELIALPVGKTDVNNRFLERSHMLLEEAYGVKPDVTVTSGGSGPFYYIASQFNIPVFHIGALYPANRSHAPNENIRVKDYQKGLSAMLHIIDGLGDTSA